MMVHTDNSHWQIQASHMSSFSHQKDQHCGYTMCCCLAALPAYGHTTRSEMYLQHSPEFSLQHQWYTLLMTMEAYSLNNTQIAALGFHMKTSKEQPPQIERKIQGVYIRTDPTHITISPCQQRIAQITTTLKQAIEQNTLQPSVAQKLAGKCAFTATQLFGRVGRAANRALYDHAFSHHTHLSKRTRQGLLAMINILQHATPRITPLRPTQIQPTIIYTDAFYQIDGQTKRCSELTEEDLQHAHKDLPNGWGIVIFAPNKTPVVTSGHIPPTLLQQFTGSNAFIYFLEAWTAVIAPVLFQPLLTRPYIQLCDNEASKHAMLKGTGKHQPLNNIIGTHWTWHNRCQLHQVLDRVPSKANIADPFGRGDFSIANKHGWRIVKTPHTPILQNIQNHRRFIVCSHHRILRDSWT